MSERIDIGFGDPEQSLNGFVRAGVGGLLQLADERHDLTDAALAGTQVQAAGGALALELEPLGEPALFADGVSHTICRAHGSAFGETVECLATRVSGPADGGLVRDLTARFGDELAFALRAHRGGRARRHGDEQVEAFALRAEWDPIADPLLSTTYAGDGAVIRAGLELWEGDETPFAMRLGGETVAAGRLGDSLVALCLWHHAGLVGCGHYVLDPK